MRLELAPYQALEDAKARRVPLVMPVGTIEYHGPHCPLGCDTQIAVGMVEQLERRRELVAAPPIWYGVASYAVAGPEKNTVHIDVDTFEHYVAAILQSLLEGGWRNIYLLIHHQYEEEGLMPMTLACMKAGKKVTMAYLERTRGNAWWGGNANAAHYAQLDSGDNPFNWVTVLPCMSARAQAETGYDHAGKWESSLLEALCPGAVDLSLLPQSDEWFIQSAAEANAEVGRAMLALSLEDLETRIV